MCPKVLTDEAVWGILPGVNGSKRPPGHGQFGPQGHGWQDLCRRSLNIATCA